GAARRARTDAHSTRDAMTQEGESASDVDSGSEDTRSGSAWPPRLLPLLRTVWPWLLLGVLVWLGWHQLKQIDLLSVHRVLHATDLELMLAMLAATAVTLAIAGLYDVTALGPRALPPSVGARWTVGVVSFAWSNFIAVGPLAGPALRLWLYRPLG